MGPQLMGRVTSGPNPFREPSKLYLAVLAVMAVLAVTGAAMAATPQEGGGMTIIAEFKNVGPLTNQTQVKIANVQVGTSGAPELDPVRGVARVPLNLDPEALPIHLDATARIDQVSLIGEKFVELTPGTAAAPAMQPGGVLPASQTSLTEDYQNIVQTLDDPTAAGLSSTVRTLGQGIVGRGQNVQQILQRFGPAFRSTDALAASLNRQNGILGQIVDQVQPLANGQAADNGKVLDRLVGSATNLLGTTAVNEAQLRGTIAELPSTLSAAQQTLGDLTDTARETETTLRDLRPTSDNLTAISGELRGFTDSAQPALQAANPLLDRANELLDQARPLAAELRQTGQPLFDTVNRARPVTTAVTNNIGGPYGTGPDKPCGGPGQPRGAASPCFDPRVQGLLGFLHNWALTTNAGDGLQHYFRVFFVLDADEALPTLAARNGVPNVTNTLTKGAPQAGGSATGLNPAQEQNALGYLMGGR